VGPAWDHVRKAFASPGGATPDLFGGDPGRGAAEAEDVERAAAEGERAAMKGERAAAAEGERAAVKGERAAAAYAARYIPVGRLGAPEDVGNMVTYLASPAGDWITGAVFVVDGGESLAGPRVLGGG
jgi:NAD(P)-dependent dehydrogenase (short-subunit alcohol dehydrogenase family)